MITPTTASPGMLGDTGSKTKSKKEIFDEAAKAYATETVKDVAYRAIDKCTDKCAESMKANDCCADYADGVAAGVKKVGRFAVDLGVDTAVAVAATTAYGVVKKVVG